MTSLEWRSAIILCKEKNRKFIPIILDNVEIPAILSDINYIDAFGEGFNSSKNRIRNLFTGNITDATFNYKNLIAFIHIRDNEITIKIECTLFTEPNAQFAIACNEDSNLKLKDFEPFRGSESKIILEGTNRTVFFISPFRPLTVGNPLITSFTFDSKITFIRVMHVIGEIGKEIQMIFE